MYILLTPLLENKTIKILLNKVTVKYKKIIRFTRAASEATLKECAIEYMRRRITTCVSLNTSRNLRCLFLKKVKKNMCLPMIDDEFYKCDNYRRWSSQASRDAREYYRNVYVNIYCTSSNVQVIKKLKKK